MDYHAGRTWITMQAGHGSPCRQDMDHHAGRTWITMQAGHGSPCRQDMDHHAGRTWITMQAGHGLPCRQDMDYHAGRTWITIVHTEMCTQGQQHGVHNQKDPPSKTLWTNEVPTYFLHGLSLAQSTLLVPSTLGHPQAFFQRGPNNSAVWFRPEIFTLTKMFTFNDQ